MIRAAAAVALFAACGRAPRLTSCADDLGGVWRGDGSARWVIEDRGATLQVFPLFDDAPPGEIVTAPRWMALRRDGASVGGELRRRFMQRADACEARTDVHVTRCEDNSVSLVLTDPPAPLSFSPCHFPPRPLAHLEHWRRE